jgi:pyruvate/2-oxoglutarate dehydrogenase complex dihydrolipoamide dehydrogenase (E3) component
VAVGVDCADGPLKVDASHVLLAVGRRPNTDDLGLDAAGITTDARGFVAVDDQCRTNVPGIWAIGDCNGRGAFTHTAYNDYEIVAENLFDGDPRRTTDRIPCIPTRRSAVSASRRARPAPPESEHSSPIGR